VIFDRSLSNDEGPPEIETPAAGEGDGQSHLSASGSPIHTASGHGTSWLHRSRAVNWWAVHEFVAPRIEAVGPFPMLGTPAWCDLPDDHPVKWAAILDASQHWALRVDTCQEATAATSRTISAALDWPAVAKRMQDAAEWLAARPWMRRSA
jgi:Protein of unknown function (DUF2742)